MSSATGGLSAFLFTDIEGSSVRWLKHRAAMEKAVARHDTIMRKFSSEHGGKIFKAAGDAFFVYYSRPADAANAAIDLQRALQVEDFSAVEGLKVRMALHFGSAERRGKDFFGPALNRTARLLDLAHGGQILVSAAAAEVIAAERDVDATLVRIGSSPLDDPTQSVDVLQLVAPGLPRDFPPMRPPKNDSGKAGAKQSSVAARRRFVLAALAIAVAIVAAFLAWRMGRGTTATPATAAPAVVAPVIPEKSIAVLPFDSLSKDEENAFFTNGMQDEILTDLARIADLKVISRSSVMHYKTGVQRNLREIGNTLGVAYVLEGSVQRAGGKVRVTAQLIDTRSDAHVWAQRYDRDLADVFAIQSEVAEAIAAQLRAKISPAEKVAIAQPPTKDMIAYDLYRRALELKDRTRGAVNDREVLLQCAQLLDDAVARDPSFLLAQAQLAQVHDLIYWFNHDHTTNRLALAEAAVRATEMLNPEAGETHLARAIHSYWGFRDLGAARRELELAKRLLPNDAEIPGFLGLIDRREGRWEDALRNLRRARELDPQSRRVMVNLWSTYRAMRRYRDAMESITQDPYMAADTARLILAFTQAEWTADLKPARAAINIAEAVGPDAARDVAAESFDLAEWERDPTAAAIAYEVLPAAGLTDRDGFPGPRAWYAGRLARMRGDAEAARSAFTGARAEVSQVLLAQGDTAPALCRLAVIDAYLGRREDAIREAKRACDLVPLSRDKIDAPRYLTDMAAVHAILGEKDLALELLAVVTAIPGGPSYADLKLGYDWDSLRGDARFDAMVAMLAPKESIK